MALKKHVIDKVGEAGELLIRAAAVLGTLSDEERDALDEATKREVHDLDNLMRVRDRVVGFPHKSYSLLGINNRDLRTFKVDLGTTLRLAELVGSPGLGTDRFIRTLGVQRIAQRLRATSSA